MSRAEKYPCFGTPYPDQRSAAEARGEYVYRCIDGHFHVEGPAVPFRKPFANETFTAEPSPTKPLPKKEQG